MKKLLSLLLAGLLCAFICISSFSCSNSTDNTSNASDTTAAGASDTAVTETEKLLPKLPEEDYEGYEFRILEKGPAHNEWGSFDIDTEQENGEIINDAVFRRNGAIEDQYNCKIIGIDSAGTDDYSQIKKAVLASDDAYDAVVPNMLTQARLAADGYLMDLMKIPYIDLTQPWWDQRSNADNTIGGKLFFTVGDLFIMDDDATWLVIFNKKLIDDLGLENPYDIVRADQWTFDKLLDMCKGVSYDVDGDGEMTREDFYGNVSQGENMTAYYLAAGEHYVKKDSADIPALAMDSERSLSVIEKIYELMYDNTVSFNYWDYMNEPECFKITQRIFEADRAVFKITALQLVIRMRNMETNFGIIPMPKFDAQQTGYYHYVHPTTSAVSIPITIGDPERTGVILEALAAESRYTVRPAYYEVSISGKFLRDEESIEMLDIILDSRVFDLATMFGWNGLSGILEGMYVPKNRNFVSTYEKNVKSYQKAIDKTVAAFEALN